VKVNVMNRRELFILLFALLLLAFRAPPAHAQTPDTDQQMLEIAKGLYCPVCTNIPLDVCDTQACEQWRQLIKEKLAAGQTQEQITQYFVEQYGDRVLGTPPAQGFNLGAYVLPFVALLLGALALFLTMRSWRAWQGQTPRAPVTYPAIPKEYAERIARELGEIE
jgi:cytochrome c-type biogenesis protein CcmH